MTRGFLLCSVGLGLALVGSAGATTYVVRPDGSGDFPTIQAAIDACSPGDGIELADGTFTGSGNRDLDYVGKALTIRSQSGNASACVIDCQGSSGEPHRGAYFHSGENASSVLAEVTITGGYAGAPDNVGGGVLCWSNSAPRLTGCVISGNEAVSGGGLESYDSAPTLDECVFSDNRATIGGGMATVAGGPVLNSCRFEGNQATEGGGLFCNDSAVMLSGCRFEENAASAYGAGMNCLNCAPTLAGCIFAGNSGRGTLYCHDASPRVESSTFWGNTGDFLAGGIILMGDAFPVLERTIIGFTVDGPSIVCDNCSGAYPTLSCCDLFGNDSGDYVYCIADQYGVEGNFSADPLFCDPENGDFRLQADSPCAPGGACDLIGADGVGCEETAAPVTTWGSIKAMFR
jgi:hypothetical protein